MHRKFVAKVLEVAHFLGGKAFEIEDLMSSKPFVDNIDRTFQGRPALMMILPLGSLWSIRSKNEPRTRLYTLETT